MSETKGNEPAFPYVIEPQSLGSMQSFGGASFSGLTKREYFAGLMLQGMMARSGTEALKERAARAVRIADVLLAELSKE